jgi:hypothetical protein
VRGTRDGSSDLFKQDTWVAVAPPWRAPTKDNLTSLNAVQNVDPGLSKRSGLRNLLIEERVDSALLLVELEETIATVGSDRVESVIARVLVMLCVCLLCLFDSQPAYTLRRRVRNQQECALRRGKRTVR